MVVNGARQVGKSTLTELIVARSAGARELCLDDPAVRAAAESDPGTFVRHDRLLMIDEIQRVPELLLAIKLRLHQRLQLILSRAKLQQTHHPGHLKVIR